MVRETILIVDDSVDLQELLGVHILPHLGYQVLQANDGEAGLHIALEEEPDLIMLDMNMPRMNGLSMLRAMRAQDCQIPVVFMTVHGSEKVAVEAFRLGVSDYLTKPFSSDEAANAVDRALERTRLEREREELSRNLLAAETVRQTVTTLAHHINNQLMAASGNLILLREGLDQEEQLHDRDYLMETLHNGFVSVARIEKVLRALQQVTQIEPDAYYDKIDILDIESALRENGDQAG